MKGQRVLFTKVGETERAYKLKAMFGRKESTIYAPKSLCIELDDNHVAVIGWFVNKNYGKYNGYFQPGNSFESENGFGLRTEQHSSKSADMGDYTLICVC